MKTIVFDVTKEHNFLSLGNGDYCTAQITNSLSRDLVVRLQTVSVIMESIKDKKHKTIDYGNLFYSRWSAKMLAPAYGDVQILRGGAKNELWGRFNTIQFSNNAPKIISL